jgi:hypothetical protein
MGQIAHPGRRNGRATAVLAPLTLVAAVGLVGCGTSLAGAPTALADVVDAQVVHPDGSIVTAVSGLRLHRGDLVRTGPSGRAEMLTRSRAVYVGPESAVQLLDGARQQLRHGDVVVDAEAGPGLLLAVGGLSVQTGGGSAVRAERSVTVRVGALVGSAAVTSDTGRSMVVPALSQVVVGGASLPDSGTPLHLTDDNGEAHAAPALVRDDLALDALAAGIDATGRSTVHAVAAAWHTPLAATPVGVGRSEQVLPVVIAAAGRPKDAQQRYVEAVGLRTGGGSWGVIAHRLDTDSGAVLRALDVFEHGARTGQVGTVPAALAFVSIGVAGTANGSVAATGRTGSGGASGDSTPTPGARPTPSSSPSGPTDTVVGTVTDTIDKVLKVLPTPTPSSLVPGVRLPALPLPTLPGVSPAPVPTPSLPH